MARRTDGPIRIYLVDDHELARRGLASVLATDERLSVVGDAGDCTTGLDGIRRTKPDLILMDIRLPGIDGLACLEQVKLLMPRVPVVMVTFYDDRGYLVEALRLGASGYLLKDSSGPEILETIWRVLDGQLVVDPELLRSALTGPADEAATPRRETAPEAFSLTPRERDVLELVAEGLTNKEIGVLLSIAEDTVKKHVQNLIWKLRAADRTQAAIIAHRIGILRDG
jgi:DNA-binding NarL/FixJ family response regulator